MLLFSIWAVDSRCKRLGALPGAPLNSIPRTRWNRVSPQGDIRYYFPKHEGPLLGIPKVNCGCSPSLAHACLQARYKWQIDAWSKIDLSLIIKLWYLWYVHYIVVLPCVHWNVVLFSSLWSKASLFIHFVTHEASIVKVTLVWILIAISVFNVFLFDSLLSNVRSLINFLIKIQIIIIQWQRGWHVLLLRRIALHPEFLHLMRLALRRRLSFILIWL